MKKFKKLAKGFTDKLRSQPPNPKGTGSSQPSSTHGSGNGSKNTPKQPLQSTESGKTKNDGKHVENPKRLAGDGGQPKDPTRAPAEPKTGSPGQSTSDPQAQPEPKPQTQPSVVAVAPAIQKTAPKVRSHPGIHPVIQANGSQEPQAGGATAATPEPQPSLLYQASITAPSSTHQGVHCAAQSGITPSIQVSFRSNGRLYRHPN